jgi:hypothetical protein
MVVHPGAGTGGDTLVHALLAHCAGKLSGVGGVERPGIVHRLDRETSGVIIAAKTDHAHRRLARAFADRETQKEYLALVAGVPDLRSGSILKPIKRHTVHRHRMTVGEGGRPSRTDWTVEKKFGEVAAVLSGDAGDERFFHFSKGPIIPPSCSPHDTCHPHLLTIRMGGADPAARYCRHETFALRDPSSRRPSCRATNRHYQRPPLRRDEGRPACDRLD